jgi:uncharacterized protein (DUF1800 family)
MSGAGAAGAAVADPAASAAKSSSAPQGAQGLSSSGLSESQAARFLSQATFGATPRAINELRQLGYARWLDVQFATPPADTHADYVKRGGPKGCTTCDSQYVNAVMESFWLQAVTGPDQLRQRTAFALSQIFVVSAVNSALETQALPLGSFLDMLGQHTFGNFRDLLEMVSRHPAMGFYLSHFQNQKEDPATGRIPDQNYAREIMQLFSIGLWELNPDGSRRKDAQGRDIPTYGQKEITGMSRVFTGWSWAGDTASDSNFWGWEGQKWDQPMRSYPQFHSMLEKTIIRGVTIPARTGPDESLRIALDTLFNHPNTGPFIASQLIKRLVTSNPSRPYIARVARVFANNGRGVRGDMKAVWRAILLDPDARNEASLGSNAWGKLREPILRYSAWMRAFGAKAPIGKYQIWNLEDPVYSLGQNPFRAPSVFNWFRPEYAPPGLVAQAGISAPEFQITHETTFTGYANFVSNLPAGPVGWDDNTRIVPDYRAEVALASNPKALLDRLSLLLTAGRLGTESRSLITRAISSIRLDRPEARLNRVRSAVVLVMMTPEFMIEQ